jgi:hypothetical protein
VIAVSKSLQPASRRARGRGPGRRDSITSRIYPAERIEETKWRAVQHAPGGKLIDFGKETESRRRS